MIEVLSINYRKYIFNHVHVTYNDICHVDFFLRGKPLKVAEHVRITCGKPIAF
jgi:hypothetical protein